MPQAPRRPATRRRTRKSDLAVAARFGANLKAARLRLGITQVDLAKLSGLQATRIPSIERGTSDLRLSTAQRLSDALGVPLSDLLTK